MPTTHLDLSNRDELVVDVGVGNCAGCEDRIEIGDTITRTADGALVHPDCDPEGDLQ